MIEYHRESIIYIDEKKLLKWFNKFYEDEPTTYPEMISLLREGWFNEWTEEEFRDALHNEDMDSGYNGAFVGCDEKNWIVEK